MTTYLVRHELRKKSIEIEIRPEDEWKILRKKPDFLYSILKEYKIKSRYTGFIDYRGLRFKKIDNGVNDAVAKKSTFAHRTDGLSACDNPRCTDCDNGHYEKCRYR